MKNLIVLETGKEVIEVLSSNLNLHLDWSLSDKPYEFYLQGEDKHLYEIRCSFKEIVQAAFNELNVRLLDRRVY